jgi:hypothetical protein
MGKPDTGVKPIDVSILLPSFTASRLTPVPRCANIILPVLFLPLQRF